VPALVVVGEASAVAGNNTILELTSFIRRRRRWALRTKL